MDVGINPAGQHVAVRGVKFDRAVQVLAQRSDALCDDATSAGKTPPEVIRVPLRTTMSIYLIPICVASLG